MLLKCIVLYEYYHVAVIFVMDDSILARFSFHDWASFRPMEEDVTYVTSSLSDQDPAQP